MTIDAFSPPRNRLRALWSKLRFALQSPVLELAPYPIFSFPQLSLAQGDSIHQTWLIIYLLLNPRFV